MTSGPHRSAGCPRSSWPGWTPGGGRPHRGNPCRDAPRAGGTRWISPRPRRPSPRPTGESTRSPVVDGAVEQPVVGQVGLLVRILARLVDVEVDTESRLVTGVQVAVGPGERLLEDLIGA